MSIDIWKQFIEFLEETREKIKSLESDRDKLKEALEKILSRYDQYERDMQWCPDCEDNPNENGLFNHREYCTVNIIRQAFTSGGEKRG